ncbi:hypothetical protein CTEN210_12371 [Chaetoceros tenuissimus]|uniref:Peptidase M20 dimerisation domain-containing protein n=1 Tax=Chaetoceros tenuissimus TaxID=426638 RepID=A0AAD3HA06_9STRA|nr:hypothetical protein CTEN210_12371 [Chaetoceros tenuissimus]
MKLCRLALFSQLLLLASVDALPFGSRVSKDSVEDDSSNDGVTQEKKSVRGATSKVARQSSTDVLTKFYAQNGDDASSLELKNEIHNLANSTSMQHFLVTARRSLHRHPEVMYQEEFTSEVIQDILKELDIPFTTGWAKNAHPDVFPGEGGYGIVAHIGSQSEDQPCIILRADMDALPILEQTKYIDEFKSRTDNKMHACGHDGHVTMLLGAAALLKSVEAKIPGTVRLLFQPAEEGGAGGKRMVEEGAVSLSPQAQHAFGMHVWPTLPTGAVASRSGPLLAAAEMFEIHVEGKGGHAAMPHLTKDPIVAVSSLVLNLQTIVARNVSPLESGVISVTQVTSGDAFNVIPANAIVKGTIRALSTERLMELRDKVQSMTMATISDVYGCNATISFSPDFYPPTVNDENLFQWSKEIGALVSKEGTLRDIEPTMGGEDFAFIAEAVPSTFFLIGQGSGGSENEKYHVPRTDFGLHHPSFALDEHVMPIGVELHSNLAIRSILKLALEKENTTAEK